MKFKFTPYSSPYTETTTGTINEFEGKPLVYLDDYFKEAMEAAERLNDTKARGFFKAIYEVTEDYANCAIMDVPPSEAPIAFKDIIADLLRDSFRIGKFYVGEREKPLETLKKAVRSTRRCYYMEVLFYEEARRWYVNPNVKNYRYTSEEGYAYRVTARPHNISQFVKDLPTAVRRIEKEALYYIKSSIKDEDITLGLYDDAPNTSLSFDELQSLGLTDLDLSKLA